MFLELFQIFLLFLIVSPESVNSRGISGLIINVDDLKLVQNEPQLCYRELNNNAHLLLIQVHSLRGSVKKREAIRKTMGSLQSYKNGWEVRMVFIIGQNPSNPGNLENSEDLIVGTFNDKSKKHKQLMGFKWMMDYCPHAHYILKMDDTVFINLFDVFSMLSESENENLFIDKPIICQMNWKINFTPNKDNDTTDSEYSNGLLTYVPEYCTSWAYIIRTDAVKKILEANSQWVKNITTRGYSNDDQLLNSQGLSYFSRDDIWITGFLRKKARLQLFNINPYYSELTPQSELKWRTWYSNIFQYSRPPWIFILIDYDFISKFTKFSFKDDFETRMFSLWSKTINVYTRHSLIKYTLIVKS